MNRHLRRFLIGASGLGAAFGGIALLHWFVPDEVVITVVQVAILTTAFLAGSYWIGFRFEAGGCHD